MQTTTRARLRRLWRVQAHASRMIIPLAKWAVTMAALYDWACYKANIANMHVKVPPEVLNSPQSPAGEQSPPNIMNKQGLNLC